MAWTLALTRFVAGLFLANAVPHFTKGIAGEPFPSPFASPPGRGMSSPLGNVLWGWFNLAVAWVLLTHPQDFQWGWNAETAWLMLGILFSGLGLALFFGHPSKKG